MEDVIKLRSKYDLVDKYWTPHIVSSLNGQDVKIAKVKGDFIWHDHKEEDELFFVIKGKLYIEFRDGVQEISEGDMIVVPKGVEHRPYAEEECWIILFEPSQTKHTGGVESDLTVKDLKRI